MRPSASIIIPAHNEGAIIGRLLEVISPFAKTGQLEVHVICNGCVDDTSSVARRYYGVTVHELGLPSKSEALNCGDRSAGDVYPRLYIDADVVLSEEAIWKVIKTLSAGEYLAAAPQLRVVVEGRPWIVRDFYAKFMESNWVKDELIGSGFYALSREGRTYFDSFPNLINDDLFVRNLFSTKQRCSVKDAEFWVQAPLTVRALIRAKTRVQIGNSEYLRLYPPATMEPIAQRQSAHDWARFLRRLRSKVLIALEGEFWSAARQPVRWRILISYAIVRFAIRAISLSYRLRGKTYGWGQDRTTRMLSVEQ